MWEWVVRLVRREDSDDEYTDLEVMTNLDALEGKLRTAILSLPDGLQAHILRVEAESRALAATHGVDEQRTIVSALGHDLVRHLKGADLLAMASRYGLAPDAIERASPILVHGPVAAQILVRDYGFEDAEVLAGIDCHTTARAGMAALEQVLFVADKIEPHKLAREAELGEVKELAEGDLRAGVLKYLDLNLAKSIARGWQVHPRSLEARNELLALLGKAGAEA
jgi:predicted HD superfamily hydrolase involved in NAD metabolism